MSMYIFRFCAAVLAVPAFAASLITHEWGTFTSVAGEDGNPVAWTPLAQSSDLPCFVHRMDGRNYKFGPQSPSLVRMETPVLYFYTPRSMSLSVRVDFPKGLITEWYPQGSPVKNGWGVGWKQVDLTPEENPAFPAARTASH